MTKTQHAILSHLSTTPADSFDLAFAVTARTETTMKAIGELLAEEMIVEDVSGPVPKYWITRRGRVALESEKTK